MFSTYIFAHLRIFDVSSLQCFDLFTGVPRKNRFCRCRSEVQVWQIPATEMGGNGGMVIPTKNGNIWGNIQGLVNVPFWGYWTSPLNGNYR